MFFPDVKEGGFSMFSYGRDTSAYDLKVWLCVGVLLYFGVFVEKLLDGNRGLDGRIGYLTGFILKLGKDSMRCW